MGSGFSYPADTPDTYVLVSKGDVPQDWDHWGYTPTGVLKPAQHMAALHYRQTGGWQPYNQYARAMQPTEFFGVDRNTFAGPVNTGAYNGFVQSGYVRNVVESWKAEPADNVYFGATANGPLCTPDIFPSCTYSQIEDKNIKVVPLQPVENDLSVRYLEDVVKDQVDAYRFGNFSYVDNLNSQDTSEYIHPCDGPSLLDEFLPIAAGAAAVLAKTRFIDPEMAMLGLPSDATFALTLNAFLAGYYLGKQLVLPFGVDEANGYKAAMCISRGVSYVGASYFTQNAGLQPLMQLGVNLLSAEIVTNVVALPLAVYIDKTVGLTSIPMRAITAVFRVVQRWLCHVSKGAVISCDDADKFPDARRWAIAELSAKIVDELCAEEGWHRDSPQARFAYEALLANPAWAMAGMNWTHQTSWQYGDTALNNAPWNLAGEIVQTSFEGNWKGNNFNVYDLQNPDETTVNNNASGFANANMIACQQYDILKAGTGKGTAGADPLLAPNFAANILRWKESVRKSAWDPANWVKAQNVFGKLSSDDPGLMAPQLYLQNCTKSLANGGFDDFKTRGEYAQLYTTQGSMSDEDWMLIQINQYLAGGMVLNDSIDVFAARLTAAGVTLNLCGCIAYMAREPENGPQRIFWREWLETEDAQVKACFGLFTKDTLIPPLLRHLPMLPPPPPPPVQMGPHWTPFGPGEHLTNFFGNLISPDEVALLLKQWDGGLSQSIGEMGESYLGIWPTEQQNNLYANAFDIVTGTLWLANQTTSAGIEDLWNQLEADPIMTRTNQIVNIPQLYAIMFAILTVRPPKNWNTILSNTWDAFVAPLTPAHAHILSQYNNPYARTALEQ